MWDRGLVVLFAQSTHTVDGHIVSKVILEESIPLGSVKKKREIKGLPSIYAISAIVLLMLLGVIGYYYAFTGIYHYFFAGKPTPVQREIVTARTAPVKTETPAGIVPGRDTSLPTRSEP